MWQTGDVFSCTRLTDHLKRGFIGRAKTFENLVQLIDIVLALEERLAAQEFGQNTSHGPYVDC